MATRKPSRSASPSPTKPRSTSEATSPLHLTMRDNVVTSDNDNLSSGMSDLVPEKFKDKAQFLDIVQWNIEWFGATRSAEKDRNRFDLVVGILEALNSDLFVFQEIAGPSSDGRYEGVLDAVARELRERGAGDYVSYYASAGGEQRVAMMWDRDWIRAKDEVRDLFPRGHHRAPNGKDAFAGRTPLFGYFAARIPEPHPAREGEYLGGPGVFPFQALGVHLKAMPDGHVQRLASSRVLANWLSLEAAQAGVDSLILGDWNAPPDDPCWKPFHDMEDGQQETVKFRQINDPSDFSYLWLQNQSSKFVSRIDLAAVSLASESKPEEALLGQAIRWKPIEEAIARAGSMTDRRVREVLTEIKETISDHLPVISRFYLASPGEEL